MPIEDTLSNRFEIKKIGTGSHFRAGSFTGRKKIGLAGALRSTKSQHRRTTWKNLSTENLKTTQRLIGEELEKLPIHSAGLNRRQRKKIMLKAERMVRSGEEHFTRQDKADLKKIVNSLGAKRFDETEKERLVDLAADLDSVGQGAVRSVLQNSSDNLGNSISLAPEAKNFNINHPNGNLSDNTPSNALQHFEEDHSEELEETIQPTVSDEEFAKIKKETKNLPDMDIG